MNNFKKRFIISLLAFPIIYVLLYQKIISNLLIVLVCLFCVYEWNKIFYKKNYLYLLGLLILLFFFVSLLKIYNLEDNNLKFLWLILIAWLTDIGGYVFGKLFKGPKLIKISPNKTWSGAFGSLFLSQFAFLIFYLDTNYKLNFNIFFLQILLSIIGQTGDLLMSYIKRINSKKDTSNLIPGHGGFLDRVDGLIWIVILGNFLII
ncbi:MAG: phosphatidate cytidylyltransferase [Candidatus Fonsibacter sp.]|nr:phosphatidate cytidylyltransferase [Candidatus Fonsibacter sp.]